MLWHRVINLKRFPLFHKYMGTCHSFQADWSETLAVRTTIEIETRSEYVSDSVFEAVSESEAKSADLW